MIDKINCFFHGRVFRAASLSLLSTILVRAINLVSIPVFSRLLTTAEYGSVDVFMSYANIFMFILGLDTHASITKAKLDFRDESEDFMTSNLLFSVRYTLVIAVIVNLLYGWIRGAVGLTRFEANLALAYGYALYVLAFRTAENNYDYQFKKNILMNGTVALMNLGLSVVFLLTWFQKSRQLGRIIGAAFPTIGCAFFIYVYICNRSGWKLKMEHIRYSLKFGVPLIPHNLSHLILSSADRIMIKAMISASDAGIYSLSYTLGLLLSVVTEGMNQAFAPWLFRKIDAGQIKDVTKGQRLYLMVYATITILVMCISPEIVKLIGPREYWDGARIVIWVVFAVFLNFTYTLYVNIEFFYLKSNWISTGTILAAMINCGLNFFFLKRFGYRFGAYSTVLSYAALLAFHMVIVNVILKKRYVDDHFVVVVSLAMMAVCIAMNNLLALPWVRIPLGVILAGAAIGCTFIIHKKQGPIDVGSLGSTEVRE